MEKLINEIKVLGMDMINEANSGHPGVVLGAAPMAFELFANHMNINPKDSKWINRDRFIMSAGHGTGLLYSLLHLFGYDLSIEDCKAFRQINSKTPGHPELFETDGVDSTSGPLGQGIGAAIGSALAQMHCAAIFNTSTHKIFDHYTYAICGDGDLQEGVAQEAMSLAGNLGINNLVVLYDSNDITLDGDLKLSNQENVKQKIEAMNWEHILVKDGNDLKAIANAINTAKKSKKPVMIEIKTIIGEGVDGQGTSGVHGSPIGPDKREALAKKLNINHPKFEIDSSIYDEFKKIAESKKSTYDAWTKTFNEWKSKNADMAKDLENLINKKMDISKIDFSKYNEDVATRASSGNIFNEIQKNVVGLIGGSADLISSTKIKGIQGNFNSSNLKGNNIMYGIREFAMASINNGIAAHGVLRPFASGFFVFSDYAKPAIRLASLMHLPTLYQFTHDSIAVGEDGPTHQPVEQIAGFRAQPNLNVFRPADSNEVAVSYEMALAETKTPSMLILTRQDLPFLNSKKADIQKGGYIVSKENKNADLIIIASGSEVSLALETKELLAKDNVDVRVVSMPCVEIFDKQSHDYKKSVIGERKNAVAIELSSDNIWYKYARQVIGMNSFGASAPAEDVFKHFKFTAQDIVKQLKK